ncbi:hypothetical protein [Intestinibacter sp.]|uniref:hypothetical protein n=1 Tax=Intestinibacter sp. TaxID=1965304 RepID=UPI003F168C63
METYYTKKEYNEMKTSLTRKCKSLQDKITRLEKKLKEAQEDYDTLLTTATESRN